jgi:siroheme synthase
MRVLVIDPDKARAALVAEGRCASTPAIAVENAGRPEARLLHADLGGLGAAIEAAEPTGPVLLVIGDVAARAWDRSAVAQPQTRLG